VIDPAGTIEDLFDFGIGPLSESPQRTKQGMMCVKYNKTGNIVLVVFTGIEHSIKQAAKKPPKALN
jgi:hypothetical protein